MNEVPAMIGRYVVERLLGEGGMGVLYLARDPVIDRHVALKLLRVNGEDLRRRLMREAQSAGRLQHPNIVTVYDVGDHDGQLYIAMEYIDGDTLATLIRADAPFSIIRKLDIVDEVADGLGYAHQRGIIHRDIKPANLMMSRAGLVKVLDFGIARLSHRESGEIDGPTLIGTPAYMAPEQLEGSVVDARSDIYAVGLVMYELFTGRRAFAASTTAEVLQQVLTAQPIPIDRLVPNIDPDLVTVITRAMARHPGDRYQDLQAMRKDLARARRRAMQASADEATIVVGVPASFTMPITAPVLTPVPSVPIAVVHPPASAPPGAAAPGAGTRAQEDVALAHLAAARRTTRPVGRAASDETVYAPLTPIQPPATEVVTPAVRLTPPALPPRAVPAPAAPVPPQRTEATAIPVVSSDRGRNDLSPILEDDGPMPVPLPAVPSSGVFPVPGGGRSTVDAPVIAAARDRANPGVPADPPDLNPPRAASPPRMAVPTAPPPVAAPGAVQSPAMGALSAIPSARKGVPATAIVVGMLVVLAFCFLAAYLAVRSFGLLPTLSWSGLLTRTVEPATGPTQPPVTPDESPVQPPPPTTAPTTPEAPGTDVPIAVAEVAPPPSTQVAPPAETPPASPPATTVTPTPATPAGPPAARTSPTRDTRPPTRPAQVPAPPPPPPPVATPVREAPRETASPVTEVAPPPRGVERREPNPPPVAAPDDEARALVRAYVAARNTGHASGIRRVWPDVDDNHLRRVTSSFSAPLSLATCQVTARDAAHATATCQMTQPGTTGAYASGQSLTIRRTFVFDLVRQGRTWVIAGLRE